MIIFSLLLGPAIALYPPQQAPTNYQRVILHPDPKNGYDDYVRATDLIQGLDIDMCLEWSPKQYSSLAAQKQYVTDHPTDKSKTWTDRDEARLEIASKLQRMDYLGIQRRIASESGAALTLIHAGNQKNVWDPREKQDAQTMYPELSPFRKIAKLLRADAYVRFAEGDAKGGTTDLLDSLTFGRRIASANLLAELVGMACQQTALAGFEEHLSQLSDKDAETIAKYAETALAEISTYTQALERERQILLDSMDVILTTPAPYIMSNPPKPTPEEAMAVSYLEGISSGERQEVKKGLVARVTGTYSSLIAQLGQDESKWPDEKSEDTPVAPPSVTTPQDAVEMMAHLLMPSFDRVTLAMMRTRAQLRLLDLHARIIDFRWHMNRLPSDLKEVANNQLIFDPLAKTEFQYEPRDGGYRLYSKGVATTGLIELKYTRPASLANGPNDPIPPSVVTSFGKK